jgi:glycosyltransferase involved in cell wall biosynthesis
LVHDFLVDVRGAERVFIELCEMWPEADIYTAVYDEKGTEGRFAERSVHASFLQKLRPSARTFRALLPLYPAAIESFDFSGYDLVVSSSSAWAHAILCDERTVHVSYCHNPFRYVWNDRDQTLGRTSNPVARAFLRGMFRRWRQWDWIAAQRTDRYVANSHTTRSRIRAYFGRDAAVVYPPVDTGRFSPGKLGEHYTIVSELMPHKRLEDAIEAFNQLGLPLIVIGDGPDARRLRREAEEFGIAAVECQAAGRPVIARRAGGALETVIDGVTGCWWSGGPDELSRAVLEFDDAAVDPKACLRNAQRFDSSAFRAGIEAEVERAIAAGTRPSVGERQPLPTARLLRRAVQDVHR